jgi:hypothetical protein
MQWEELLLVDGDGQLFVNYLLANDRVGIPAEIDSRLAQHKEVIEAGFASTGSRQAVLDKYVWMADYHNYVQREFFDKHEILIQDVPRLNHRPRSFGCIQTLPLEHAASKLLDAANRWDE